MAHERTTLCGRRLLISRLNAGSISHGDAYVTAVGTLRTVTGAHRQPGGGSVQILSTLMDGHGIISSTVLPINQPVDRVVGGRSGGHI